MLSGRVGHTMLKIRLQRVGRRNHAEFRVVVSEHTRTTTSTKYVALLGSYSPHTNTVALNDEKVRYWLSSGAQPSGTVHNLFVTKGLIEGKKINVLPKKTPVSKEVVAK
jgi:small subunit ribosomal protein S16